MKLFKPAGMFLDIHTTPSEIPTQSIYRNFPVRVIVTLFYDQNAFTQLYYYPLSSYPCFRRHCHLRWRNPPRRRFQ